MTDDNPEASVTGEVRQSAFGAPSMAMAPSDSVQFPENPVLLAEPRTRMGAAVTAETVTVTLPLSGPVRYISPPAPLLAIRWIVVGSAKAMAEAMTSRPCVVSVVMDADDTPA